MKDDGQQCWEKEEQDEVSQKLCDNNPYLTKSFTGKVFPFACYVCWAQEEGTSDSSSSSEDP
jgi:hypothetical protein